MHRGVRQFISWLEKHSADYGLKMNPPATSKEITELEHQLGMPLPDDLRFVYGRFNGGEIASGEMLPAGTGPTTIEAAVREIAERLGRDFLDPELLLPFLRSHEGSLLAFDRSSGPVSDTWSVVDYFEDTGEVRLVHRTFDGWCAKCVADWTAPDFDNEFTLDSYLRQGERHVAVEPDVASGHATVAHALKRAGRPDEAMRSYLRAARCVPPLPWCDWEALKLAVVLNFPSEALEAASRLSSRATEKLWKSREVAPDRIAEAVGLIAWRQGERASWLRILDQLVDQSSEQMRPVVTAIRWAVNAGQEPPLPRPLRSEPIVPAKTSIEMWWNDLCAAYRAGKLREDDLLFDPSLAPVAREHALADLLRIRRDF